MNAIKTDWNGTTYRSRLEAEVAQFFSFFGPVDYEPKSFLLEGGIHYMPDFWVEEMNAWVEARGYRTHKGDAQLVAFAAAIGDGRIGRGFSRAEDDRSKWTTSPASFFVIVPGGSFCADWTSDGLYEGCLVRCGRCGKNGPRTQKRINKCLLCGKYAVSAESVMFLESGAHGLQTRRFVTR